MAHLLHLDSSVEGELSVSRRLTARAAQRWRATRPGDTITYRDSSPTRLHPMLLSHPE